MSETLLPRKTPTPDEKAGFVSRKMRCRLANDCSGPGFTDELAPLLRSRLRLAILLMILPFAIHFVRNAFQLGPMFEHRLRWLLFGGAEVIMLAGAAALLWSRRPFSLCKLRKIEVMIFGSIAVFFGWLQVETYYDSALLAGIVPGQGGLVFRLVGLTAVWRWFLLIVLYGAFIPNTWQRCAAVVGSLAAIPILLLLGGSLLDPSKAAAMLSVVPETILLVATAVVIAVFGSRRIHELQRKAHQAERIGQYRLKQVLGFGGMGTVYLAEHVLLRRPCALKMIRPDQAGDPKTLVRFEREVQAAATLTHWNTIEIFDYGHTEDGTFYYVMEYLPGMNLEDMVEQYGAMPPERAVHFLRQVCQALREAHGIGLIHRDIKPSNIFACERGKVQDVAKLLDFGLVTTFGGEGDSVKLTRDGAITGSPAFMSPEQARGRQPLDLRTDIYNVGAVAYYLMTGQLPFDRVSTLEMLHAHGYEQLVPSPAFQQRVPADLQSVVLRCLEKEPDSRYQDAMSLDKALAACDSNGQWTMERAEEWWQGHGSGTVVPSPPQVRTSEQQTVPAVF